jgi:outer membrane biosynthesis protein TonB
VLNGVGRNSASYYFAAPAIPLVCEIAQFPLCALHRRIVGKVAVAVNLTQVDEDRPDKNA